MPEKLRGEKSIGLKNDKVPKKKSKNKARRTNLLDASDMYSKKSYSPIILWAMRMFLDVTERLKPNFTRLNITKFYLN